MKKFAALLVVGALALVGCGSDSGDEVGTDDIPGPTARNQGTTAHMHGGETATCTPTGATMSIVASNATFNTDCLAAPSGQAVTLTYENKDSQLHNLVLLESHTATEVLFRATEFTGPKTMTFTIPADKLTKKGTFAFHCEFHRNVMMGTFIVA